jgi:hypothetical protein
METPSPRMAYAKAIVLLDEPGAKFSTLPHATRFKELGKTDYFLTHNTIRKLHSL